MTVSDSRMRNSDKRKLEVLGGVLQLVGIIFAITFGIFAVLAWEAGANQLKQAEIANQLTFLSYCAPASATSSLVSSCSEIIAHVNTTLIAANLGLLPAQPETPAHPTPRPGSSQSQKVALAVGIAIGVPSTLISLIMTFLRLRHH